VTVDAKLMLTNALFPFVIFIVESSRHFHYVILLPKFSSVELPQNIVLVRKA